MGKNIRSWISSVGSSQVVVLASLSGVNSEGLVSIVKGHSCSWRLDSIGELWHAEAGCKVSCDDEVTKGEPI